MKKKLRIEDLKRIKESTQRTVSLRAGAGRAKITVHMGTCGIAAGSRPVMNVLLEKIESSGATDILLTSSGCAGLCSREPMITVQIKEAAPIKYGDVTAEIAATIFDEHVIKGHPVEQYAISLGSETTY